MTPADTNRNAMVWPLADLFEALRREGFHLRPDDYREVVQVLDTFQPRSPADLQALITPLIVTSEEEQEKFDRIFWRVWQDEGLKPHTAETKPDKPEKDVPWLWIATGLLALLVLAYVAFLWPAPTFRSDIQLIYGSVGPIEVGDTLVFSVDSSLQQAAGSRARWRWETPEGKPYPKAGEPALGVIAQHTGPHRVKLRSQRGRGLLFTTWTDSLRGVEFTVCNKLPVIQINRVRLDSSSQRVRYRFSARVIQPSTSQLTQWQFDGGVVAQNQNTWEHTFQTSVAPAYHDIRFSAFPDTTQRLCYAEATLAVNIPATNEPSFTVEVRQTGNLIVPKTQFDRRYYWALWVLGSLLVLLIGYYIWLVDRDRRKKKSESPLLADPDNPLARFTSDEPPLEIPLENRDAELITRDQLFYQLVRMLRQPTESELQRLHVARTIQATMHEGGFPTLMFQARLVETEYLFLIDRSQVRSQQVALFEYLFRAFVGENVCVERFFFHKTFDRFTNETHPKGLSLRQLTDAYHHQTLLIWSNGSPLLYPPYPVVEPAIREALTDWESRAILTPVPFADWGSKERALQADFLLLPADLTGQLRLIQALQEKQTHQDTYLRQQTNDLYSTEYVEFQEVDELRDYLGEALFQWLAALALYPRIRWEIVVEMGRALLPPEAVNFTNLLKLARISWMHEGNFPDYTRLELLKALRPENEAKARQTLLRMLTYAEQYFPGEHVYDGEKYLLQTVSQFTLYAHDAETFAHYQPAQQAFKKLYEKGLYPDGAMLRYLENPYGQWSTLLLSAPTKAGKSVVGEPKNTSLTSYLDNLPGEETDLPAKKQTLTNPYRNVVLAAVVTLFFVALGLWYVASRSKNQVINQDQQIPITIALDTNACVNALNTSVTYQPRWTVFLNDSLYTISNLQATRSFPLRRLVAGSTDNFDARKDSVRMQVTLAVNDTLAGSERQYSSVNFMRDTLRVRINCRQSSTINSNTKTAPTVYIQYASSSQIDEAARLQTRLKADGFVVPGIELRSTFRDSTQVRYFADHDRAMADSVARSVKVFFKLPTVQVVKVSGIKKAPIEVWLNNISPSISRVKRTKFMTKSFSVKSYSSTMPTDTLNNAYLQKAPNINYQRIPTVPEVKVAKARRMALVIGNADYVEINTKLRNPVNDATDMINVLSSLGFDVISYTNLSQTKMRMGIKSFFNRVRKGDVVLVYYSGSGFEMNGVNYLAPVDAKINDEASVTATCIKLDEILERFNSAQSSASLLIIDACLNKILGKTIALENNVNKGLAAVNVPSETFVAYASNPGGVAFDGDGRNGTYTEALLADLKIPGLSIFDIFKRVNVQVRQKTNGRQLPWFSSSLSTDFYFSK